MFFFHFNAEVTTRQKHGACWAHVIAMIVFHCKNRLGDRNYISLTKRAKLDKIYSIKENILRICNKSRDEGCDEREALPIVCRYYKLYYNRISERSAKNQLDKGRYVLAAYSYNSQQFKNFNKFFDDPKNENCILTKKF